MQLRRAFLKSLVVPVLAFVFFALAPVWLERNVHAALAEGINRTDRIAASEKPRQLAALAKLDLAEVCRAATPGLETFRANLERTGVCANFERLRWALYVSTVLLAVLLGAAALIVRLNRRARRSPADLIAAYRLSWKIAMAAAFAQVFLLLPLLTYGTFELTVLAFEQYFPKLLIVIILGGLIALWRSAAILLKAIPLEFDEPLARALTPEEAPELWQAVRRAAERLNTRPPDGILVGMQFNFYVTELAVKHGGGRTEGRTLYLSYPLMRHLAEDEVLAIIGHELGHFIGEDTRLTREFYPLRLKVQATMLALAGSGFVAWPSLWLLESFAWCFGATEQATSRHRELLADAKAAELTSPATAARALVRFHAVFEAFQLGLADAAGRAGENLLDLPVRAVIREKLVPKAEFWTALFEAHTPHPLDSHPALHVRLESLGQRLTPADAQMMAIAEESSAYDRWFAQRDSLFTAVTAEAAVAMGRARAQAQVLQASQDTEAGRRLLQEHFPEVRWAARASKLWIVLALFAVVIACGVALVVFVAGPWARVGLVAGVILASVYAGITWLRHHGAELVLTNDGLAYTGWRRPLPFAEVATITALNQYSSVTITFHLKARQDAFWRYALPFRRRRLSLDVSAFKGGGTAIAETIYRYVTRQIRS